MIAIQSVDVLLERWESAETDDDAQMIYRSWRGEHLKKHREFKELTQREMGDLLELSQSNYTKLEQALDWKKRGPQIAEILNVPSDLIQSRTKARRFLSRDGGLTYAKLLEKTISRWSDEGEQANEQSMFPLDFILNRVKAEQDRSPRDARPQAIFDFLANPTLNDLDQQSKRWIENILDLELGSLADLRFYKEKQAGRQRVRREVRKDFLANVERLLSERRWSVVELAAQSGLKLADIADESGKLLFQPLTVSQIAGVSIAFEMDFSMLTMENGTDMQRESSAAFRELPASVRAFFAWIHSNISDTSNDQTRDGAIAITAMLPLIRAQLEQISKEACHNPKIVEAMKGLFEAYKK